jgi:uncharacterized repeat protein (TIGR01451 family)
LAAVLIAFVSFSVPPAGAQSGAARVLITAQPNDLKLVRVAGNTRPEANASNDRGRVPDTLLLEHMLLLLKRPPEREAALQTTIEQLHDRRSPSFHHWLTNSQYAARFGLASQDVAAVTHWLTQQGFSVNTVYPGTLLIDFTGTAGQVSSALHTEIHYLDVRGSRHLANMSDPQIPAALAPAVAGIVSLNDFRPHPANRPRAQYTVSAGEHLVAPADLATIYNLNPLFSAGTSGSGQTVVVIEDTNVYSSADWTMFRSAFGLASYTSGSFDQAHPAPPTGSNNCGNPGVLAGNEREAEIDAEWASAAAPNAAIVLASCADTSTTFGGLIALQNLLSSSTPPAIVSISYGACEAENGATANAAYNSTYEQAVALGTSVFVSAGDEGAASCDADQTVATHGVGVNAFASTPYNVAVGGTDFADSYAGTTASYWNSTNSATYGSARSYVPEIPWNDSCAGALFAGYEDFSTSYGTGGFCNSTTGEAHYLTTASGSGGPSGCATGAPLTSGVVSGTCQGYAKPSWQSAPGVPDDGVRDLPDVSLFAANGLWGHYYVYCDSDTHDGGAACTGAPSTWSGAGGTSFGAPILAGIQALIDESTGERQGNPNYVYYALAAAQASAGLACNSSSGNQVSSGCVFYDVTLGDMDVDCQGSNGCYLPSGTYGVLSTSDGSFQRAYGTGSGWDFATGIGTLNAGNLVAYWNSADLALTGSGSVTGNGLLSYALQVSNSGPQTAAGVAVTATLPSGFTLVPGSSSAGCAQSGQTLTCTIGSLANGQSTPLTIVIQPGGGSTANVSFAAVSSNPDIDPGEGTVAIALNLPTETTADGPLPVWTNPLLAVVLMAVALRTLPRRRRDFTKSG